MTIGEIIRNQRKSQNLTQKQLGEKLGGISQQQIGQWETGKVTPKLETLEKISEALGITIYDFIDDTLYYAATSDDPAYEDHLLNERLKSLLENQEIEDENRKILIKDYAAKLEIISNMHKKNAEAGLHFLLQDYIEKLNYKGIEKAFDLLDLLIKIPEYQRDFNSDNNTET